jgi:hypothetical protein
MTASRNLKIVLLGNSAVEKITIFLHLSKIDYERSSGSTFDVDYKTISTDGEDSEKESINLHDSANQDCHKTITSSYVWNADSILLV